MVTLTYENTSPEDHFNTKPQSKCYKLDQSYNQQQKELTKFKEKKHQESKNIKKELVPTKLETL